MRESLIRQNLDLLREGLGILAGLGERTYAEREARTGAAGIGEHFRHCVDFYECFLRGAPGGRVDYDARDRDARVERDLARARARLAELAERLEGLDPSALPDAVLVRLDAPAEEAPAWAPSTPERELQFLASHTVHHYAVVALQLRLARQEVPDDFGVARATLRHWESSSDRAG